MTQFTLTAESYIEEILSVKLQCGCTGADFLQRHPDLLLELQTLMRENAFRGHYGGTYVVPTVIEFTDDDSTVRAQDNFGRSICYFLRKQGFEASYKRTYVMVPGDTYSDFDEDSVTTSVTLLIKLPLSGSSSRDVGTLMRKQNLYLTNKIDCEAWI